MNLALQLQPPMRPRWPGEEAHRLPLPRSHALLASLRFQTGGGADPPAPRDVYNETSGELKAKLDIQPQLLAAERLYRPQYQSLDLGNLEQLLRGTPGGTRTEQYVEYQRVPESFREARPGEPYFIDPQSGLRMVRLPETVIPVARSRSVDVAAQRGLLDILGQDLFPASDAITAASQSRQRAGDIGDVETLGGRATAAFRAANPEQAALLAELNRQALSELQAGATLDPSLRREVQQSVRAGQAARGFGYGTNDVADEALFTGLTAEELRRQRQAFATGLAGLNQATTMDPFLAILGRPALNVQQGNQLFGQGFQVGRSAGPQLFGSTVNANDIFNSNFNAQAAANISNANNAAAQNSAYISGGVGLASAGIMAAAIS